MPYALLLLSLTLLSPLASAAPTAIKASRATISETMVRREDTNQGVSPEKWAPVLVIVVLAMIIGLVIWLKKRQGPRRAQPTNDSGTRILTAEILAGGRSATSPTPAAASTPANRTAAGTRRPRRGRRPSQMSVTSLPEYMKEPGEQELVVTRGPDEMEDVNPATDIIISRSHNPRAESQSSSYSEVPETPHDMPLLQNNEHSDSSHDSSIPQILPPGHGMPGRRSIETTHSSADTSSLTRVNTNNPEVDPRGEAPAYFEVVDLNTAQQPPQTAGNVTTNPEPASASPEPSSASPSQSPRNRLSGFRSILPSFGANSRNANQASSRNSTSAVGHSRDASRPSIASVSTNTHTLEPTQSRMSHRPSHSGGSGSFLNLTPFRTHSRQKSSSSVHLNSPSLISLNSISPPLTHTATRTGFTYPKSGPTPEQMKLISSREAFGRFGLPYGEDAIAYAASTSRQELMPPPGFDVPSSSSEVNLHAGSPSRDVNPSPQPDGPSENAPDTTVQSPATPPVAANIPLPDSPVELRTTVPASASTHTQVAPTSTASAPPTSFRTPLDMFRPESRASVNTYATAAETLNDSTTEYHSDDASSSEPSTPRMQPTQHALEPTDVTITPRS